MNNLVLASSSAEAASLEAARTRLAEVAGTLGTLNGNLVAAAGNASAAELAQSDQGALVDFVEKELIPLSGALAGAFPEHGASTESRVLAKVATGHNERIVSAAKALEVQEAPVKMVNAGGRLLEAATAFIAEATELILPALAQNTAVSLADLLPKPAPAEAGAPGETQTPASGGCACGGHDEPGLAELGRLPRALRFHPACWCAEAGGPLPALVAAITGPDGAHAATHRTWLAQRPDGSWGEAPLRDPKKTLGSYVGGAIRLWRGASGRPLAEAPDGEHVALAEGIETALSVAVAVPELRVLCAVSLANMGSVALPTGVRTVTLCADNDDGNAAAARALARVVDRFAAEGREVRVARPPAGLKDFNDVLTMEGPAA